MAALPESIEALTSTGARVLTASYLITLMFSMGLELGGEHEDKQAKRRQRRLLVRALLFNLILLPVIAVAVTRAFHSSDRVEVALLLLAATPGGRFAPQLARLARADRALSVEIALFLFKLVPFTAPFSVKWMLGGDRVDIHEIPFIVRLLALQMLPYLLGKMVRRRRGDVADRIARPMRFASTGCLILILAFVLAHHEMSALWRFGGHDWLSIILCAATSLAVGWLAGGRTPATRRSFALSADARNLALALVIANLASTDGNLQLTTFAVWSVFVGFNYGFAMLTRWRGRMAMAPSPSV